MTHLHYVPLSAGVAGLFFAILVALAVLHADRARCGTSLRRSASIRCGRHDDSVRFAARLLHQHARSTGSRSNGSSRARWWRSWACRSSRRSRSTGRARFSRSTSAGALIPIAAVALSLHALSPLGAGGDRGRVRRLLCSSDGDAGSWPRHRRADLRAAAARRLRCARFCRAASPRRSPISAAASASSSARISSISANCAASARRSPRSAGLGLSTAFS